MKPSMEKPKDESVGEHFHDNLLTEARNHTLAVIEAASREIKAGASEESARKIVNRLLKESGSEKGWHAPQIRLGRNTLCGFGEPGTPDISLMEDDIYFLDLGPIFGHHEGDVGRTFCVGSDSDMKKISNDVEVIWKKVRDRWFETEESGAELYAYAAQTAKSHGWILSLYEASGHRIADFPHVAKQRGSVEALDFKPSTRKWILEIHIKHPTRPFGAFFEDLLQ